MAMATHLYWLFSRTPHLDNAFQLDQNVYWAPTSANPFPNLCQKHCVHCTVLLTKLHDSSVSQLGEIILWPFEIIFWASPKGGSMYSFFIHSEWSNSMYTPWLRAFRKRELERRKRTQSMVHSIIMLSIPWRHIQCTSTIEFQYVIVYIKQSILMLSNCSPSVETYYLWTHYIISQVAKEFCNW